MKRILIAATFAIATFQAPAFAADVGVSISVGDPNFYGRIDIGGYPPPRVIHAQPVVVESVVVRPEPVYLRVPPGHSSNWNKHCSEYGACGQRVYFVQDEWYSHEYAPRYQERHGKGNKGHGKHGKD